MLQFICPHCQRVQPLVQFELREQRVLEVFCAGCLRSASAERATPSSPSIPSIPLFIGRPTPLPEAQPVSLSLAPPEGDGRCPKCLAVDQRGAWCSACGCPLGALAPTFEPPVWLAEAFLGLRTQWHVPQAHQSLRELAISKESAGELARLYRIRLATVDTDAIARSALQELVQASALPLLVQQQRAPDSGPSRLKLALAVLFLVVSLAIAVVTMSRFLST
jgi:hypothetical protein